MTEKITIEIDPRDSLVRHIEELQRTITKRNKKIEELQGRLDGEGESEFIARLKQRAYSNGYKAAGSALMEISRKFDEILRNVNEEAFSVYLHGDKIGWDKSEYQEEEEEEKK